MKKEIRTDRLYKKYIVVWFTFSDLESHTLHFFEKKDRNKMFRFITKKWKHQLRFIYKTETH